MSSKHSHAFLALLTLFSTLLCVCLVNSYSSLKAQLKCPLLCHIFCPIICWCLHVPLFQPPSYYVVAICFFCLPFIASFILVVTEYGFSEHLLNNWANNVMMGMPAWLGGGEKESKKGPLPGGKRYDTCCSDI